MDSEEKIVVWTISLDQPVEIVEQCYESLPAKERAKADRYKVEPARRAFVLARWALRAKLAERLECKPLGIHFRYGEYDKPYLAEPATCGLGFNVSHSGDWAMVAIGPFEVLGVDIERLRQVNNLDSLARTVFCQEELEKWLNETEELRPEHHFRKWTQKEACLKATGVGLSTPMTKLSVKEDGGRLLLDAPSGPIMDANPWALQTFSHLDCYFVSLALGKCSDLPEVIFQKFDFTSG
ncbi:MAG: 4'-phosphopantetheinyl transferase superfamily protein [Lacipirellulaceae bacterium]